MGFRDAAAIVGVGETDYVRGADELPEELMLQAVSAAVADAGLSLKDIDGLIPPPGFTTVESLAANLGIEDLRYSVTIHMGGASPVAALQSAATAVAHGLATHVVVVVGWNGYSALRPKPGARRPRMGFAPTAAAAQLVDFYLPYGVMLPVQMYAWICMRHKQLYGIPDEATGAFAIACRKHANLNEKALMRGRTLTMQDYLRSRWIAEPFRLFDCALETDCAAAVVVTSAERARDLPKRPVRLLGCGEAVWHQEVGSPDMLTIAARQSSEAAFRMAGVERDAIDLCMIYDSFTITVLVTLENLGFCKPGEGGSFVEGGRIGLGGELPINLDGGGLSSNHPGMRGIFLVIEAVKQLRGECGPRQVAGPEVALVHGTGGLLSTLHSGATLVLGV
jgi:acetyl-CoA acetyltransferase